jgi:hypothetical protein
VNAFIARQNVAKFLAGGLVLGHEPLLSINLDVMGI